VQLVSVGFDPVADSLNGERATTGVVTFAYDGALESCGWQASFQFSDFVGANQSIVAANLQPVGIENGPGLQLTSGAGAFTIMAPPDAGVATSGTVTVRLDLDLGGFVPAGEYNTTVTVMSAAYGLLD
jgi:hypothetical protein